MQDVMPVSATAQVIGAMPLMYYTCRYICNTQVRRLRLCRLRADHNIEHPRTANRRSGDECPFQQEPLAFLHAASDDLDQVEPLQRGLPRAFDARASGSFSGHLPGHLPPNRHPEASNGAEVSVSRPASGTDRRWFDADDPDDIESVGEHAIQRCEVCRAEQGQGFGGILARAR